MSIADRIENLRNYYIDMSKYHLQCFIEKHSTFDRNRSYVLMFHRVTEKTSESIGEEYAISASSFKQMIERLLECGFQFCDVKTFVEGRNRSKILLTFDDAYSGVYTELYNFLRNKQLPFIVFQTLDFLDEKGYLSTVMIKDMLKYDKFVLGAHTISHCNLHKSKEYVKEIREPVNLLRHRFGIVPEVFAYPYGAFVTIDTKSVKLVRTCYQYAFSTCSAYYRRLPCIKKYLIPRININEGNYKIFLERVTR